MGLYLDSGYLNVEKLFNNKAALVFCTGARGTGKTYGCLKYLLENKIPFILMRRTQIQIDTIKNDDFSPFKPIEEDTGIITTIKSINKSISAVYFASVDDTGKYVPEGQPIGYLIALSTIANIRGFNLERVQVLLHDEFIGEAHESKIKLEGQAFKNAIETIGRNRELKGKPPLKVIALANSNNLANPIYMEYELVATAEKMVAKGIEEVSLPERNIAVYHLMHSPISEMKKNTALYQSSGKNSEFYKMAIENQYSANEMVNIKSVNLQHYNIVCVVAEAAVYKHKTDGTYYLTGHIKGTPKKIYDGSVDLKLFRRECFYLWLAYLRKKVYFESYIYQVLLEKYFNMV